MSTYFGLDWVATILTIIALYLMGEQKRAGFVYMIVGNLCWMAMGALAHSVALVFANVVFITLNWRGFRKWKLAEN